MEYMMTTTMRKNRTNASLCVKCGKCEQHCPQHLPIRKELENVVRRLETPVYKASAAIMKIGMRYWPDFCACQTAYYNRFLLKRVRSSLQLRAFFRSVHWLNRSLLIFL